MYRMLEKYRPVDEQSVAVEVNDLAGLSRYRL